MPFPPCYLRGLRAKPGVIITRHSISYLAANRLMSSKEFLLITYYWPPSGGAGVMRWAKMSKYIGDFDWSPVIYTPEGAETAASDLSLVKEMPEEITVIRIPIWEPYTLYKSFLGKKKGEKVYSGFITEGKKPSFKQQLSIWIRSNFFIPDARKFWIKPSIRYLRQHLKDHPVEAIISTGPPHSMHLIAEKIAKEFDLPWVADFRDPWTSIDFYKDLKLTKWADAKHKRLEKRVLMNATKVVTVTQGYKEELKRICGRDDIIVITNGFDHADYPVQPDLKLDEDFSIVYFGSLNKDRNPPVFWKGIRAALDASPELQQKLRIRIYGPTDGAVKASVEEYKLNRWVEFFDYVPHDEVVRLQQKAQLNLVFINDTITSRAIIPGKLYECMGSRRPILAIGPTDSDSARVIGETNSGYIYNYDDLDGFTNGILSLFDQYKSGALQVDSTGIEKFTRQNLARQFANLLTELTD